MKRVTFDIPDDIFITLIRELATIENTAKVVSHYDTIRTRRSNGPRKAYSLMVPVDAAKLLTDEHSTKRIVVNAIANGPATFSIITKGQTAEGRSSFALRAAMHDLVHEGIVGTVELPADGTVL